MTTTLRIPPSRYPITIHLSGLLLGIEVGMIAEFCPPDMPHIDITTDEEPGAHYPSVTEEP